MNNIFFIGSIVWVLGSVLVFIIVIDEDCGVASKISRTLLWPVYLIILSYLGIKEDLFE